MSGIITKKRKKTKPKARRDLKKGKGKSLSSSSKKERTVAGRIFKPSTKPTKVSKFTDGSVSSCFLSVKPVPVDCSSLDKGHFKKDKKTGRLVPQMKKKFLDDLVDKGIVEDYIDFYHKYVGVVQSPRNSALYLVWTAVGTDAIWAIPSASLKYFSLTKDCASSIFEAHCGQEIKDALSSIDTLKIDLKEIDTVQGNTMKKLPGVPFFDVFHRGEGGSSVMNCALPRIDARSFTSFLEEGGGGGGSRKESPKRKTPDSSADSGRSLSAKPSEGLPSAKKARKAAKPAESEEKVRNRVVFGSLPSTILDYKDGQKPFLDSLSRQLPNVPFSGKSKEEIIKNANTEWTNSFSVINGGYNTLDEDEVALVLGSRISTKSNPPMAIKNLGKPAHESDKKKCTFSIAGMDPSVKPSEKEGEMDYEEDDWGLSDDEKISLVQAIFKAIVIPICASEGSTGSPGSSWYECVARDMVSNSGLPIERILASPDTVDHFFNKLMKQEDVRTLIGKLYLQHKFSGLINHHICS
jgi:hypothetical protein